MPDTVERWAPIFLFYEGTTAPKFKPEQVLKPDFALHSIPQIGRTSCKLCDDLVPEGQSSEEHMKAHCKELNAWQAARRREAEKRSKFGLKLAREARAETARVLAEVSVAEEED